MPLIVPHAQVQKEQGYGRAVAQILRMYVEPELKRRKRKDFRAAAVEIFDDGHEPRVLLDHDLTFELRTKTTEFHDDDEGAMRDVALDDIDSLTLIEPKLSADCASVVLVAWGTGPEAWILELDFRYNKTLARRKLERAREFLEAAKAMDLKQSPNAAVYTLWSALELLLDVHLWMLPKQKPKAWKHTERMEKMQAFAPIFPEGFCEALERIWAQKNRARYADEPIPASAGLTPAYLRRVMAMLEEEMTTNPYLRI